MLERRSWVEPFRVKVTEARTKGVAIAGCARQVSIGFHKNEFFKLRPRGSSEHSFEQK